MIQGKPEEDTTEMETEVGDRDIGELEQALAEEKQKSESHLANWQRAQADFINYKRRSEQEKGEIGNLARSVVMITLLPILDDLERALTSIPPNLAKLSWVEGIRLIERKLRADLETQGLSPINAVGEPFDPNLHEAAMHGKGREGIVVEELQKGYTLHDRVLRPAMVVVGQGEAEDNKEIEKDNKEDSAPAR